MAQPPRSVGRRSTPCKVIVHLLLTIVNDFIASFCNIFFGKSLSFLSKEKAELSKENDAANAKSQTLMALLDEHHIPYPEE